MRVYIQHVHCEYSREREAFVILRTEPCCPFPLILRAEAQQQLPRGIMANFGQLFFWGGGGIIIFWGNLFFL